MPTIWAVVKDRQTTLTGDDVTLSLDGQEVADSSYDGSTNLLSYTSTEDLAPGRYTVQIVAADPQGLTTTRTWRFWVVS